MEIVSAKKIELWGGIECTINRINEEYLDQLEYAGHYEREDDIEKIASVGIKRLRYPVLWEKYQPEKNSEINWSFAEVELNKLRALNITPIAGLVHHGSGPVYVSFFDGSFENELARYASMFAKKFPWIEYYTPVNEPLTTARFCGLYGLWYPHEKNDYAFARILVSECKGIVMAMHEIRKINPHAKLVQTDDLLKVHSVPSLAYQADFENERRWLAYDLISGRVDPQHPLWNYLIWTGIDEGDLYFLLNNHCKPDIIGLNYYVTSERFLDDNLENYPVHTHGANNFHQYADIEAVRVSANVFEGPYVLIKEAWQRFKVPIAVTEAHLNCHREDQIRWFNEIWEAATLLKNEGVNIEAVTAWALLGSYGWNKLLTEKNGDYEPGVFDVRSGKLRPTAMADFLRSLTSNKKEYDHILQNEGWWKRRLRIQYHCSPVNDTVQTFVNTNTRPLVILGKTGTLGNAFARICAHRNIHYKLLSRNEVDITKPEMIENVIRQYDPWAIVNAAGYVNVDGAESDSGNCLLTNATGSLHLATNCDKYNIQLLSFSSDLVFDGHKSTPYYESDPVNPLNVYGSSKMQAEQYIQANCRKGLIIRTSAFFGPWDRYNFITTALQSFKNQEPVVAANDVFISPTYVPDLVNNSLDLLIDKESGIWHLANEGEITWADLALTALKRLGSTDMLVDARPLTQINFQAKRPYYTVLKTEKGLRLPTLENALDRYFNETSVHLNRQQESPCLQNEER